MSCRVAYTAILATLVALSFGQTAQAQQRGEVDNGGLQIVQHGSSTGPAGTVRIVVQLPGVIAPGDNLTLSVHQPVRSEREFLATTTGRQLGGILATSRVSTIEELQPDAFGLVELIIDLNPRDGTLPDEPDQIRLVQPGVYPVSIELRTVDQELVGRLTTHLIRLPDATREEEAPPRTLRVVLVGEVSTNQDPRGTALGWLAMLGRHPDVAITTTITPELFDLHAGTPELAAFTNISGYEIVRGAYFRVEEGALLSAGLQTELDGLLAAGDDVLERVGTVAPPTVWVGHGVADAAEIQAVHRRGVRDVVIRRDALSSPPLFSSRRPVEATADAISVRALLVDELAPPQAHDTGVSAAQRIASHLATIAFTGDGDEIITLDVTRVGSSIEFADALLSQIAALPLVETVLASEAIGSPLAVDTSSVPVRLALLDRSEEAPSLAGYRSANEQLGAYRSMIRDEDSGEYDRLTEELRGTLASDVSTASRAAIWERAIDFVRQQTSLVDAPPETSINLTSRNATVPFSFQNRSDTALRVEVRLISDKLQVENFDDGESTTIVLEPGITTHDFSLRALSTGSFPVTIELHSPDGTLLVSRARAVIRSTAPTGVGLGLTLGAAIFLLGWWVLDLRRRRVG